MLLSYVALLAAISLSVLGQVLLKTGVERTSHVLNLLLDPFTLLGLATNGSAAILYILAIRRIPLTIAFPSAALSYVAVAVLAHFLWNEPLGWPQFAGIVLIGGGLVMLHVSA